MTRNRVTTMLCVWALVAGAALGRSEASHYGGGGWFRRNHPHSLFAYNSNKPLATFHAHPTSLIDSLLHVRGGNDETLNDETPYHLLSVLPATASPTDDKIKKDHWLPPGCTALTTTSTTTAPEAAITMHWGHPDVWQSTNLALVESLALMSDVVVLTLTDPDGDAVTTDVAKALQRGWQRRLAQGLTPGRLWVVWTDNKNVKHKNKKKIKDKANEWMSEIVSNEWTAELSTPSKSPDLIADWRLCHGPVEYTTAIREFVLQQEGQENNDSAPLVPVEGIPTLLRQVYNLVGKSHSTAVSNDNPLFLPTPVVSELPAMIASSLKEALPATNEEEKQQPANTSTGEEPLLNQDYGPDAEPADATNVWLKVEVVQNQLDEYWLTDSKSGISMPPDLVKAITPILPNPRDKKQATTNDEDLTLFQQRLVSLTEQHAGILRDYYGRLYESLLDNGRANDKSASSLSKQYRSVAQRVTKTMQRYVEENINDIYQVAYQGLQEDFFEIMDRWKSTADVLFEDEEEMEDDFTSTAASSRRIRLPPWLQRLSVRILVLGVNYLQGWLAWQGVKRAALARERQMPKFPLF